MASLEPGRPISVYLIFPTSFIFVSRYSLTWVWKMRCKKVTSNSSQTGRDTSWKRKCPPVRSVCEASLNRQKNNNLKKQNKKNQESDHRRCTVNLLYIRKPVFSTNCKWDILQLIIHQIFSLARDWSKHATWSNIPQLKLGNIRDYYIAVSHKDWELPNPRIWLAEIDIKSGLDFPI